MPFISVIIPCYNAEQYINKCLCALERQTYKDFNVILIDDCSADGTASAIEAFKNEHELEIVYSKNEKNFGPGKSRNNGILLSEAKYIAFCDSDDWYEPDYLQLMAEEAQKNDADMVFCNSQKVLTNGNVIKIEIAGEISSNFSAEEALSMGIDSLCSLIVKREIIIETPQPDLRNGEDMAIIPLMIMKSKQFGFVKKSIYNYLCRPGSLSLSANESMVKSLEVSFEYILKHRVEGHEAELEYIGIKNVVYGALLNHFKFSSDKLRAKEILESFEKKFPNWTNNKYIKHLPIYKKIYLKCAKRKFYMLMRFMSILHARLTH